MTRRNMPYSTSESLSVTLAWQAEQGFDLDHDERLNKALLAVRSTDLNHVFSTCSETLVLGVLGPEVKTKAALDLAGWPRP